jgi:hypothetical protein
MASATELVTRAQLELRFGPRTVALYVDDDGDELGDSAVMALVLQEGSQRAVGLLLPGFSEAQILKLVDNDAAVRGYVLDICADVMGRRRPEHFDADGNTPYTKIRERAEAELSRIAKAETRARGESQAATNEVLQSRTNLTPSPLQFSKSTTYPTGQGGF